MSEESSTSSLVQTANSVQGFHFLHLKSLRKENAGSAGWEKILQDTREDDSQGVVEEGEEGRLQLNKHNTGRESQN